MRYQGPIYRPPSEAHSLLIQATVGCPHNKCTFCMVYKKGPKYQARPAEDVIQDLEQARAYYGSHIRSVFFPAGNSIAMPTEDLARICKETRQIFPRVQRVTVYGSAQYIWQKGVKDLQRLQEAGLSRIHVGLESGNDQVLDWIKKGSDRQMQIEAGQMLQEAGLENSTYVVLGLGGKAWSREHAEDTASALNLIRPEFVRLRTLVPKVNTVLLKQIQKGKFQMLEPHKVLQETRVLLAHLECAVTLRSDHYTNYIDVEGSLPGDKNRLLKKIDKAMQWDAADFRPFFVGTQ